MTENRKKITATFAALSVAATFALSACSGNTPAAETTTASETEAAATTTTAAATTTETTAEAAEGTTDAAKGTDETDASNWKEKLLNVNGVIGVEEVIQDASEPFFGEKYIVTFEQPLDWSNPDNGSFPQRVEIGLHDGAGYNVMETNGYLLFDSYFPMEDAPEMSLFLDANYINVEHRFFGQSRPEDMTNDDIGYWEYHTAENAANDYHRIYTSLSELLGDKWISIGTSRGGLMTNVYGHYFPDDMLIYTAYVAPCSNGMDDPRFYDFVYNEIGNDAYGEETAQQLRDLILSFQVELMKNKEEMLPTYEAYIASNGFTFREQVTLGELYDLNVLEFAVQCWQKGFDLNNLSSVLSMPETTEEELQSKMLAELNLLLNVQSPSDWSSNSVAWPYYVNTATTYGQYHYDFSYLRAALKQAGLGDRLTVTPEMENDFLRNIVFTEEQKNAFVYDDSFYKELNASIDTTTAKHLMIFGGIDPWRSVRIHETDNENVRAFINPTMPHSASILNMPEEMQAEAISLIKEWLGILYG